MSEALPFVSVCVPAFGSKASLRDTCAGVKALDYPADRFELVVAIDGPEDALAEVAREFTPHVVVLAQNAGSYAARNAALDAVSSDAEFVAFTDSDCVPTPGWLRAHLEALRHADLSGGAVRFTHSPTLTAAEYVDMTSFLQQQHLVTDVGFAATCNLAGRADVFRTLRFDATLRSGGDLEFGLRARAANLSLVYAPEAAVEHAARRFLPLLRKVRRVARGARRLPPQVRARTVSVADRSKADPRPSVPTSRRLWALRARLVKLSCSAVWALYAPNTVVPRLLRARG